MIPRSKEWFTAIVVIVLQVKFVCSTQFVRSTISEVVLLNAKFVCLFFTSKKRFWLLIAPLEPAKGIS
jgi:hypothetical protein